MSASHEDTLRQFCEFTGANEARSRFFLESSNWQLEVALSSFYENGGNIEEAPTNPTQPSDIVLSDSDMDSPPGSPPPVVKKEKAKPKRTNQNFATLATMQQDESSSDEEQERQNNGPSWIQNVSMILQDFFTNLHNDNPKAVHTTLACQTQCRPQSVESANRNDELEKEVQRLTDENIQLKNEIDRYRERKDNDNAGQAFYAGGSDRSGQQILGPGKGKKDIVNEMFKSVRERGAVVFEDEPSSTSRGGTFTGTGYRLGQTPDDHQPITPEGGEAQEARSVRLRLYREGFTVDGGELRSYLDPEHAKFLNCIRRGEVPPSLGRSGGEVRVSLEDRRLEECPREQARGRSAFQGKGQLLGSPTPPVSGAPPPAAPDAPGAAPEAAGAALAASEAAAAAQQLLAVDDKQPTTTLQIRLADGSRLTGRFNHTHTVAQLREYVSAAAPHAHNAHSFVLLTAFPSAELSDPSATLAQANLLNSLVVQRLK